MKHRASACALFLGAHAAGRQLGGNPFQRELRGKSGKKGKQGKAGKRGTACDLPADCGASLACDEGGVCEEVGEGSIVERTWLAARYHSAERGGLVDVIPGSVVTLALGADGRLGGSAGCNEYAGGHGDRTPTSFAIDGPVAFTERHCDRPAGVMEQERAYLHNFADGRGVAWEVSGDGALELRDSESGVTIALYDMG